MRIRWEILIFFDQRILPDQLFYTYKYPRFWDNHLIIVLVLLDKDQLSLVPFLIAVSAFLYSNKKNSSFPKYVTLEDKYWRH